MTACFGCLYYAALCPEEAVALRLADCHLPGSGWGMLRLTAAWTSSGTSHEHCQLAMRARIMTADADYDAALLLLSRIHDEGSSAGWRYAETAARIELAAVLWRSGQPDAAIRTAVPALAAGARAGLLRTIIDTGPDTLKIIGELRAASRLGRWPRDVPAVSPDYLSRLLATAHSDAQRAAIPVIGRQAERNPTAEEPLSPREIDILRLLDRGLSNKEIARALGLTINTVKWYLKNIYTKLGVARRGESVAAARRRRILT